MTSNLKHIINKIDALNQNEKLKVFQYLVQQLQVPSTTSNLSDSDTLFQYIEEHAEQKSDRSLKEFKGIAPNLLEGEDAQDWIDQQRNEWTER